MFVGFKICCFCVSELSNMCGSCEKRVDCFVLNQFYLGGNTLSHQQIHPCYPSSFVQTWQSWYLVGPLNTGSHVSLFTNFCFPKFSPVFFPIVFPQCCIGQLVGVHSRPQIYGKLAVFLVSCFSQCFPYHLSPKISPGVFPIVFSPMLYRPVGWCPQQTPDIWQAGPPRWDKA